MKSVVWLNNMVLTEVRKPPLRQGEVLGKVVAASITHMEKFIALGIIPTDVGRILGSVGIIKAIEVAADLNSKLIGRYFLFLPRPNYVGGIDLDGVLAEYASIPLKLLIPLSESYASKPETLIYAELSFIHEIMNHVKNKDVLILGCGPTSYIITKHVKDLCDVHVACIHNQQMRSKIAELGVHITNYENLNEFKYDVIIVLTANAYPLINTLRYIKNSGSVVIPPNIPRALIGSFGMEIDVTSVKLLFPRFVIDGDVFELLSRDLMDVKKLINFTGDFEGALGGMFHFWRTVIHQSI